MLMRACILSGWCSDGGGGDGNGVGGSGVFF